MSESLLAQAWVLPVGPDRYEVTVAEPVFGGTVLAQAMSAAVQSAEGRRPHSFHGHFLRRVVGGEPVEYRTERLRSGRSFVGVAVTGTQGSRPVFSGVVSFHATADDSHVYQLDLPADVPGPDAGIDMGVPWPVDVRILEGGSAGVRSPSTFRAWLRARGPLPDDPGVHVAAFAMLSDISGRGARPPHVDTTADVPLVSLDHALWIHGPVRADEWHLYDVRAIVNAEGRALIHGTMHSRSGRLVATVAQELLY